MKLYTKMLLSTLMIASFARAMNQGDLEKTTETVVAAAAATPTASSNPRRGFIQTAQDLGVLTIDYAVLLLNCCPTWRSGNQGNN